MKKEIKEELIELESSLSEMDKPLQDSVPVMYFEGFADRLIRKMELEPTQKIAAKPNGWWLPLLTPKWAFAAASLAIILSVSVVYFRSQSTALPVAAIEITQDEAFAAVTNDIEQYDVETLVDGSLSQDEMDKMMQDLVPINNEALIDEAFEAIEIEDIL